ncbi:MAG: cyclic peptide export ABC transporter [Rhodospirillum sp.]|nr:cyclic peptide export ABC transporter [Rhodospirillum sp.]MCF8490245.1 cyclic peptide export ABC transporter [Rhodospirillum sp.]MCF8501258.1 cyclic peptide export ABC transporter [Rhodospirillum sp.]
MTGQRSSKEPVGLVGAAGHLLKPFWPLALCGAVLGTVSGLATAWLLATVNRALHLDGDTAWRLIAVFAGLGLLSVGGTALAGVVNSFVGQRVIAALRKTISARILRAPVPLLEARRAHRLMAMLTNDIDTVSAFTFNASGYAISLAIIVGSFAYLLTLSGVVFLVAVLSLAVGLAINMVAKRGWLRHYEAVRDTQDDLHKQYRAVVDGAKELKMHRGRRARVHGTYLTAAADRIAGLKSRAMALFWVADAAGSAIFFLAIAILVFGQSRLGIDSTVISGAVIVLLYVKSPVERIANALPILDQARISFQRIATLSTELDQHGQDLPLDAKGAPVRHMESLELRGVRYAFPPIEDGVPFALGPVDLTIRSGELIFIVGENGSGKTTLIKLLLGLYDPQDGAVLWNGEDVTTAKRDDYRQLFTTVFSDYYLFDDLVDHDLTEDEVRGHLERLDLAHKVGVRENRFSTLDLSTGQKKRLALLNAYLERRPVMVTDEWAADQDPVFRQLFYTVLLEDLRRQGKTLVVISHDDRYFYIADRVIRLAEGCIVFDGPPDAAREHFAEDPSVVSPSWLGERTGSDERTTEATVSLGRTTVS